MYFELLSLFAALSWGISSIVTRKGLQYSKPMSGAIVATLTSVIILAGVFLTSSPPELNYVAMIYFALGGFLASTLGRLLNYVSFERLGVSITASIIGSSPLFTTLFAFLFIGEKIAFTTLIGTFLIVIGIFLIQSVGNSSRLSAYAIIIPVVTAVLYGASYVIRKVGLNILPEATLGALVGLVTSMASYILYYAATGKIKEITLNKKGLKWFTLVGVIDTLGWIGMFNALTFGNVSIVSALIGTHPLFSILFSFMLLKNTDELMWNVVAGCMAIVSGAAIITLI